MFIFKKHYLLFLFLFNNISSKTFSIKNNSHLNVLAKVIYENDAESEILIKHQNKGYISNYRFMTTYENKTYEIKIKHIEIYLLNIAEAFLDFIPLTNEYKKIFDINNQEKTPLLDLTNKQNIKEKLRLIDINVKNINDNLYLKQSLFLKELYESYNIELNWK